MVTPFQDSSDNENNLSHVKRLFRIRDILFEKQIMVECLSYCSLLEKILKNVYKKKNLGKKNLIDHLFFLVLFYFEYDVERTSKRKNLIKSYLKEIKNLDGKYLSDYKLKYANLKERLKRFPGSRK